MLFSRFQNGRSIVIIGLLVVSNIYAVTHRDVNNQAAGELPGIKEGRKPSRRELAERVAAGDGKRTGLPSGSADYDDNWRNNNFEEDKPTYCDCISGCSRAVRCVVVASILGMSAIARGVFGLSDGAPVHDGSEDRRSLNDLD